MKTKVLVTGAGGFQGGAVIAQLLSDGYSVKAFDMAGEGLEAIAKTGAEPAPGNFEDAESLVEAFQGTDHVSLSFPLISDTEKLLNYAGNVVKAYRKSGVKTIVFNTNLPVYPQKTGYIPFDSKLAIEEYFDREQLPYISLRPSIYMDNIAAPWSVPVILNQHILPYPLPSGKRVAWISHKDLAKFTVEAIKHPQLAGRKFYIGGSQLLTGEEMAQTLSSVIGKQISYVSVKPDDFEAQLAGSFGKSTAKEIANIYRFAEANIEHLQAQELRERTLIDLPVSLQTFGEWAKSVEWKN